jgi:hypothetical protein
MGEVDLVRALGGRGGGERVVHRAPAPLLLLVFEHRELDDPQHVVAAVVDQAKALPELQAQRAERLRGDRRLVGNEQQQIAVGGLELAFTAAICSALKNLARLPRQPPSPTPIGATALAP